jgi:hypothetical protein
VKSLDDEIVDVFQVASLLLAVAAAYLAGIWPIVNDLLHSTKPSVRADREAVAARQRIYAWSTGALAVVDLLIFLILAPLAVDVVKAWHWHGHFHAVRACVLLAEALLAASGAAAAYWCVKLQRRSKLFAE